MLITLLKPHPDGVGVIACIEKALAQSGIARENVNYINAYASSTPLGDQREYHAIMHCLRNNPELRMNSTKSIIGHQLGASAAVEAVAMLRQYRLDGYIQTLTLIILTKKWTEKCLLARGRNV